jgi:phosphatidate phosphatase APP1
MEPAPRAEPDQLSRFIARWDLDKTYLRTDFDTLRDLVRTAIERPDQKRTVPGAAVLLRELGRAGVETHILSGSPEQLRGRLEQKLRLDGARWASLTLKPNLENMLRLRFRALRGQLGYKLPALLRRRCELENPRDASGALVQEVLLGDDAEADAFVYSLYADICLRARSTRRRSPR